MNPDKRKEVSARQQYVYEIIFEAETPLGKLFDVALLVFILASVIVVSLESVSSVGSRFKVLFITLEWIFTIFFTIEYLLRIYCVRTKWKYIVSFFGLIDLLAILPTYLSIFIVGTQYLIVIRVLRLLRIFRIFKLVHHMSQGQMIINALRASRPKILVFVFFIFTLVTVLGSLLYVVESQTNSSFTSIPRSIYWAIVTLTTVGYGDIAPQTPLGQFFAAMVMIMGYAIIAVPTGIVSAEMIRAEKKSNNFACQNCSQEGHENDARFCKHCGDTLLREGQV